MVADAENANFHGDVRPDSRFSRWFGDGARIALRTWVKRQLILYQNAPAEIVFEVDPKDAGFELGDLATLTTGHLLGVDGNAAPTRILITRIEDKGARIRVHARSTTFEKNYADIAPNTAGDHPSDAEYAHIANGSEVMGDGSDPYLII